MSQSANAATPATADTSTDLQFILDLFKNSNIPFQRKDSIWANDSQDARVVLLIDLPFPKKSESDEPEATMEWIFKNQDIHDMNVYAQPGPPPEPLNPPEHSFMSDFSGRLGQPVHAPDDLLGYFK